MGEMSELMKLMENLFGKKWATIIGRIAVIVFVAGIFTGFIVGLSQAIESIDAMLDRIKEGSLAWNIFTSIFGVSLAFIFMIVIALAIAILFGWTIRIGLAQPIRKSIDNALDKTIILLQEAGRQELKEPTKINELLVEVENIQKEWNTSWPTKFIHWLKKKQKTKGDKQ